MKTRTIGTSAIRPVGYVDQQGRFCSTSQKTFAQLCKEAAEERENMFY